MIARMALRAPHASRRAVDDREAAEQPAVAGAQPALEPPGSLPAQILALQRHAGNSAVSRMLAGASGILTEDEGGGMDELYDAGPGILVGEADTTLQTPGVTAPDADAALGGDRPGAPPAQTTAPTPAAAPDGAAPAGTGAGGTATAAPAHVTINSRTDMHAPDGTGDDRKTVAMGEVVYFDVGGAEADWSASAGWPPRRSTRDTFAWELADPGTASITATLPTGETATVNMRVIGPTSIRMRKTSEDPPGASGTAGAGMMLKPRFTPGNVNFGNVEWLEVPGGPSNVSGYFATERAAGRANLNHRPNPNFLRIGPRLNDHAAAFNFSPPFAVGTWDWIIPNKFRRAATTGDGTLFFNTLQSFRMDASGVITVSKQGASVTAPPQP
jgi:hypothetical protein